jgi:hypothetical protein
VTTDNMIADMFTKAVDKPTFVKARNIIMNAHGTFAAGLERGMVALHGASRRICEHLLSRVRYI